MSISKWGSYLKMGKSYFKMTQLLQSQTKCYFKVRQLFQSGAVILMWDKAVFISDEIIASEFMCKETSYVKVSNLCE